MDEHEYTGFAEIRGLNREWWRYEVSLTAFYYDAQDRADGNDAAITRAPEPEQSSAARAGSVPVLRLKLREAPRIDLRAYIIPRELPHDHEAAPDNTVDQVTVRIRQRYTDLIEETLPVNRWNGIELRYEIRGQQVRTDHMA